MDKGVPTGHRGAMAPLGGGQPIQEVHRSAMDYAVPTGHRGAMVPLERWPPWSDGLVQAQLHML